MYFRQKLERSAAAILMQRRKAVTLGFLVAS